MSAGSGAGRGRGCGTDDTQHPACGAFAAHGGEVVLRKKDRGIWKSVTWAELGARVRQVAPACRRSASAAATPPACWPKRGRNGWRSISASSRAGGVSVGIPPGEEAEQLGHVLRESNAVACCSSRTRSNWTRHCWCATLSGAAAHRHHWT